MKAQLEKITSLPQSSFKVFKYENQSFDAPWHFHPEYELVFIEKSNGIRYVGDSVMEFEENDLVLLGSNLPHCWKNTEENKSTAKSIVVQWRSDFMGKGWNEGVEFTTIKKMLKRSSRGIHFKGETVEKIAVLLRAMLNQRPFEKTITLLKVLDILSESKENVLLSGDNFAAKLNHKTNERINVIHNFVSENYNRQITLSEMANLVAMNEESFCRFFKKTFNKSFFTFLNEYKIKLACKMLIESDKQVSEIAFRSGYESLPFFYRQFNKFIGCSPLVYQQKYKRAFS